jgi:hypothetical protein
MKGRDWQWAQVSLELQSNMDSLFGFHVEEGDD